MTGPFLFLTLRSLKNRIVYRLRRFREIRYLLGAIIGGAYFVFLFTRGGAARPFTQLSENVVSIFALAGLLLPWILTSFSSLGFSEAELHFVIGGPVSRRRVLLYKFIQALPQILIAVLVAGFLRVPNGGYVGFALAYVVFALYLNFVAVARQWLNERGIATSWIVLVATGAAVAAGWTVAHYATQKPPALEAPVMNALLFVPRVFSGALFARTPVAIATAAAPLLLFGAVLFFVASTIPIQFNELVMTASERVTRFRARMQRRPGEEISFRRLTAPFRLTDGASPEMAIFWKNSIAIVRMALSGIALVFILSALYLAGAMLFDGEYRPLRVMCATFALFTAVAFPLFGSMIFKQDYRMDVTRVDVVKTWPIAGERIIASEIAAPLVVISILQLVLIGNAALTILFAGGRWSRFLTPQQLVIVFLFAVPICAMQLCLRNSMAVVFPGWGFRTREEMRGFIAMGQQILMSIINLLTLSLFLAPAAAVSAVGLFIASRFGSGSALLMAAATMPAVLLLCAEVWVVIRLLGAQLDKLDVAQDLEPAAM